MCDIIIGHLTSTHDQRTKKLNCLKKMAAAVILDLVLRPCLGGQWRLIFTSKLVCR